MRQPLSLARERGFLFSGSAWVAPSRFSCQEAFCTKFCLKLCAIYLLHSCPKCDIIVVSRGREQTNTHRAPTDTKREKANGQVAKWYGGNSHLEKSCKFFQNPLDKLPQMWYNISVKRTTPRVEPCGVIRKGLTRAKPLGIGVVPLTQSQEKENIL